MKTLAHFSRTAHQAFTITEIMISMSIFSMVMGAILYSHIAGLKMYQLVQAKMGASQDARTALNLLAFEVQASDKVEIGTGGSNSFTAIASSSTNMRIGNAIQIYPTTNTNVFIRYFLNTNTSYGTNYAKLMRRATNGTSFKVVAENVTNMPTATHPNPPSPFALEYYSGGAIQTMVPEKQQVLSLDFIFYQLQYPIIQLGTNRLFDYYEYRSKITTRIH